MPKDTDAAQAWCGCNVACPPVNGVNDTAFVGVTSFDVTPAT